MKIFNNITLICVDCSNYIGAINAIQKSLLRASFKSVKFLTDLEFKTDLFEVVKIDKITSKEQYSEFVIKQLYKYFDTDFVWIIQHDGYILDMEPWTDEFLEYDGVGAKWLYVDSRNNFNGGFSIRSKRLQEILGTDPMIEVCHPEDSVIGRLYRNYLIKKHGIKFPQDELCDRFAYELNEPCQKTIGFHGRFWPPYREAIVIRRTAAMGDVVQVEPILRYFYNKGYRVYLDTLDQFFYLFMQHEYRIEHFSNINKNMPYRLIDLDMAYERKPGQLHLKSYYEVAGIEDGRIENPRLNMRITEQNKMFKKFVVMHIDKRQPYRSIYGISWGYAVSALKEKGYDCIQIGDGESEDILGAIRMKCATLNMLQYLIAGCDGFIGIDSGPSNIALSFDKKMIVFHGSVNPATIYPDMSNVKVITNHDKEAPVCQYRYCWSEVVGGVEGKSCVVNESQPPCTQYQTSELINAIHEML